jgi:hypothetical protein
MVETPPIANARHVLARPTGLRMRVRFTHNIEGTRPSERDQRLPKTLRLQRIASSARRFDSRTMTHLSKIFTLAIVPLLAGSASLFAAEPDKLPPAANRRVDFHKDILAILADSWARCHAGGKHKGESSIDTREPLIKGGESGPAGSRPTIPGGNCRTRDDSENSTRYGLHPKASSTPRA